MEFLKGILIVVLCLAVTMLVAIVVDMAVGHILHRIAIRRAINELRHKNMPKGWEP